MATSSKLVLTAFTVWLACAQLTAQAVTPLQPKADDEVLEVLPLITRNRVARASVTATPPVADPARAAAQARKDIALARETGDTRYWGRAQAVLAPWWDVPSAPADVAVLQATVQQGRHEFDASRKLLARTLARTPGHAQGWLNLAALERLDGRYAESLKACESVARAGADLYAQACRLETQSLQGQQSLAATGFKNLLAQTSDKNQRSWLLSLVAENAERNGQDAVAAQAYTQSLALEPELYTTIAYSDLLLRTGKPTQALQVLAASPQTDAVLLRRAAAWRKLGDARWTAAREQLKERAGELVRRGDDPTLHGRELALIALWLDDDARGALAFAQQNLLLQREPIDWWVAASSARVANDEAALKQLTQAADATGLRDARLTEALKGSKLAMPLAKTQAQKQGAK